MTPVQETQVAALSRRVLQAFEANGYHAGFRPAHAKGILLSGLFTPTASGAELTRAPHVHQRTTPVWVRLLNFAGIPTIPDSDPNASPRGIAIRFYLDEHLHTDITAHSVDGFPARTAEEFAEFFEALAAGSGDKTNSSPIQAFLATHPAALEFVQTPKPMPSSFAKESYFGVNAYLFSNRDGVQKFGRYRISPDGPTEYLDQARAAGQPPDFLMTEIEKRVTAGPVRFRIAVQLATPGDVVDDSTVHWPADRPIVEFGNLELSGVVPNSEAEQRHIIFYPLPRVDGIDPSNDPLLAPRASVYLMSGHRRRAALPQ